MRRRRHILSKLVNPTKGTYSVEVYEMCTAWKCVTAYSNKIVLLYPQLSSYCSAAASINKLIFPLLFLLLHKRHHTDTHAQLTAAFFANSTQFYIFFTFLSTRHLNVAVALQLLLVLKLHGGDYRSQHLHSLASCRCD